MAVDQVTKQTIKCIFRVRPGKWKTIDVSPFFYEKIAAFFCFPDIPLLISLISAVPPNGCMDSTYFICRRTSLPTYPFNSEKEYNF